MTQDDPCHIDSIVTSQAGAHIVAKLVRVPAMLTLPVPKGVPLCRPKSRAPLAVGLPTPSFSTLYSLSGQVCWRRKRHITAARNRPPVGRNPIAFRRWAG